MCIFSRWDEDECEGSMFSHWTEDDIEESACKDDGDMQLFKDEENE